MSGLFRFAVFAVLLAAVPAAGEGLSRQFPVQPALERAPAKEFALRDLDGRVKRLSDFKGRVVLLHFWASWCEPCKKEFPALTRLAKDLGPKGLTVLAIAEDSAARVGPFLEANRPGFPVLIDQYGEVKNAYGVSLIPVSVIIGKDGMVKGILTGPGEYASPEAVQFFRKMLD